jgi:hypothetical protein
VSIPTGTSLSRSRTAHAPVCTLGGRLFLPCEANSCSFSHAHLRRRSLILPFTASSSCFFLDRSSHNSSLQSTRRFAISLQPQFLATSLGVRSRRQSSGFNFMDTAARNLRGLVGDVQSPSAGLLDFPSPASDLDIYTPGVGSLSLAANVTSNPWAGSDACLSSATSAIPDTVEQLQPSILTPAHEFEQPGLGFDTVVGVRVAPAPTSPLPLSSLKDRRDLRLPSFTQLGIAAPHSEPVRPLLVRNPHPCLGDDDSTALPRVGGTIFEGNTSPVADLRVDDAVFDHVDACQPESSPTVQPRAPLLSPVHHYVTTLTPPDDTGRITWEPITQFATEPITTPMAASAIQASGPEASAAPNSDASAVPVITRTNPIEDSPRPWLRDAITVMRECSPLAHIRPVANPNCLVKNIHSAPNAYQDPIKVLSHALPSPSTEGHAFPTIISSLHDETPTSPTCWINVFHALPVSTVSSRAIPERSPMKEDMWLFTSGGCQSIMLHNHESRTNELCRVDSVWQIFLLRRPAPLDLRSVGTTTLPAKYLTRLYTSSTMPTI